MTIFNYSVNSFDICIGIILLFFMAVGWSKGIFITVINFIKTFFGLTLCVFVSNRLSTYVYESYVRSLLVSIVKERVVNTKNVDEIFDNLNAFISTLPSFVSSYFDTSMVSAGKDDLCDSIVDNIFQPVAITGVKVLLFICVFIVFFGVTSLAISIIQKRNEKKRKESNTKSFVKGIDRILGCVFGLLKGALVIFVLVSFITYLMSVPKFADNSFIIASSNSELFNIILDYNPFNVITEGII